MSRPTVSVVVPHFADPRGLDLLLTALEAADLPPGEQLEVVVADDGSPTPPDPGERPYPVRVVRQERRGFRAAAARNLGAAAASGDVLCFLDVDTVPTPGYVPAMVAAVRDEGGERPPLPVVAVGRRRHADLTGWSAREVADWLGSGGTVPSPPLLTDPAWLADGYRQTDDLRAADDASFRFVISAVMAIPRAFLAEVGGFHEGFGHYGGEDWELAQRCWLAGARLRHVPDALAWHDGPDLAGRAADVARTKNRETLQLAPVLTHPLVRPPGLLHAQPDVVVTADVAGWTLGQLLLVLDSWLRDGDVGVWLEGLDEAEAGLLLDDPRVRTGAPPAGVLARCRTQVALAGPVALTGTTARRLLAAGGGDGVGGVGGVEGGGRGRDLPVRAHRTRDLSVARRTGTVPAPLHLDPAALEIVPADVVVERRLPG